MILARVFAYLPSFISQILDFIYWPVLIFILIYFELRDTENQQYCRSNQLDDENHFLFHCDRYKTIGQQITSDIVLKYPSVDLLNNTDKTLFLFNNVDSFIFKKLGYFVYKALHIRESCNPI